MTVLSNNSKLLNSIVTHNFQEYFFFKNRAIQNRYIASWEIMRVCAELLYIVVDSKNIFTSFRSFWPTYILHLILWFKRSQTFFVSREEKIMHMEQKLCATVCPVSVLEINRETRYRALGTMLKVHARSLNMSVKSPQIAERLEKT